MSIQDCNCSSPPPPSLHERRVVSPHRVFPPPGSLAGIPQGRKRAMTHQGGRGCGPSQTSSSCSISWKDVVTSPLGEFCSSFQSSSLETVLKSCFYPVLFAEFMTWYLSASVKWQKSKLLTFLSLHEASLGQTWTARDERARPLQRCSMETLPAVTFKPVSAPLMSSTWILWRAWPLNIPGNMYPRVLCFPNNIPKQNSFFSLSCFMVYTILWSLSKRTGFCAFQSERGMHMTACEPWLWT